MIIIKFIILYFTQITHTDDFPSTGTRLVPCNDYTLSKTKLSNMLTSLLSANESVNHATNTCAFRCTESHY